MVVKHAKCNKWGISTSWLLRVLIHHHKIHDVYQQSYRLTNQIAEEIHCTCMASSLCSMFTHACKIITSVCGWSCHAHFNLHSDKYMYMHVARIVFDIFNEYIQ